MNPTTFRNKGLALFLVVFLFGFLAAPPSEAAIPKLLTYQGILKDSAGNFLTGTYSMAFRIYTASTGGTAAWTETQSSVSASSGKFSVQLGSVTALNLSFNVDYWLSIQVGTDPEMSPRVRITSTGYAYRADTAENVVNGFTQAQHDQLSHMNIEGVKANSTNIAKTNFKLDAHTVAGANNMGDMIVDVFNDATGIDAAGSSTYQWRGSPNYDVIVFNGTLVAHPNDYTTGLKGYWKLDESTGTRNDQTANVNHLTMVGTVNSGTAARGDATNYTASADLPSTGTNGLERTDASSVGLEPVGPGGSFSTGFWTYVRNFVNGSRPMVSKGRNSTSQGYIVRFDSSGNLIVHLNGNQYTTSSAFSLNTWYQVGVVFDEPNDKLRVYRNGSLLQEWTGVTVQLSDNTEPFQVGKHVDYNAGDSLIDDVGFWNNVQPLSTFNELYNGRPNQSGTATVKSVAFPEAQAPKEVIVIADETPGTGSITYQVSRDNGTNWTACAKDTVCNIDSQPSGTQIRWKASITGNAELEGVALAL